MSGAPAASVAKEESPASAKKGGGIKAELDAIERTLDDGTYKPGPWAKLLKRIEALPREERITLAEDVSRVGDKLHSRNHTGKKVSVRTGVIIELMFTIDGIVCLYYGLKWQNGWVLALGAFVLCYTMQVLTKMAMGTICGVKYSYFYRDFVVEARVKMRYGTYLAASRFARLCVHIAGTAGSPLAVGLVAILARPTMPLAFRVCEIIAIGLTATQVGLFMMPILGIKKVMGTPTDRSSGGSAARELMAMLRGAN